jgi:hypothetical protein
VSAAYVVRNVGGSQCVSTLRESWESALLSVLRRTELDHVTVSARLRRMEVGDRIVLDGRPNGPLVGVERVA